MVLSCGIITLLATAKYLINFFFKASDKNGVRDENEDFNALCRGETISASVDHQVNKILILCVGEKQLVLVLIIR